MIPIRLDQKIDSLIPGMIKKLCTLLSKSDSTYTRALIVGGAVVDLLQNRQPKDWDIEVYGLSYERIVSIMEDYQPKTVGKKFGVIKLSQKLCEGYDIDISVPRRDNNTGVGHTNFDCVLDPSMTPKEAAKRRDFTMNSMFIEPNGWEGYSYLHDPCKGLEDLHNGVLRATCPNTFIEDPLRALRAMQLLPRKAKSIDPSTMQLIKNMVDQFQHLSKERVKEEFDKLLLKANKPSTGLRFLQESGWLVHFPELHNLINCEQNPEWHPEGDVWEHTCEVVDAAAYTVRHNCPAGWEKAFMYGAMLHDVGKPATTITQECIDKGTTPSGKALKPGQHLFTAWEHDTAGVEPTISFLERITNDKELIKRASDITKLHMQPYNLFQGNAGISAYRRLHNKLRLDVLGLVSRCDCCGRPTREISHGWPYGDPDLEYDVSKNCFDYFSEFGEKPIEKIIQGKDLIKEGMKPGPLFKYCIDAAYQLQLDGIEDRNVLLKTAVKAAKDYEANLKNPAISERG